MTIRFGSRREAIALKRRWDRAARVMLPHIRRWMPKRRTRTFVFEESHGSALVEMVLVLPPLLALFTGICAFGIAFNNELTLTRAVGVGAQYLQVIRATSTDPCADTLAAIAGAAPNLNSSKISLTLNLNGTNEPGSTCSGGQTNLVQGAPVTVTATYPCALSIYGTAFASPCLLTAKITAYEY